LRPGDVLVAMSASGLHSNGYSLARHVLLDIGRMPLHGHVEEFGHTLGEELLTPTRIYARDCLAVAAETGVRTFAHITGGGLARNLERVLPPGLEAVVERGSWTPAAVFGLIAARGRVERAEMEKTFNMGVGMVAVLPPDDVDRALAMLTARHVPSWVLGRCGGPPRRPPRMPPGSQVHLMGESPALSSSRGPRRRLAALSSPPIQPRYRRTPPPCDASTWIPRWPRLSVLPAEHRRVQRHGRAAAVQLRGPPADARHAGGGGFQEAGRRGDLALEVARVQRAPPDRLVDPA
jgi:hypothetical protein